MNKVYMISIRITGKELQGFQPEGLKLDKIIIK